MLSTFLTKKFVVRGPPSSTSGAAGASPSPLLLLLLQFGMRGMRTLRLLCETRRPNVIPLATRTCLKSSSSSSSQQQVVCVCVWGGGGRRSLQPADDARGGSGALVHRSGWHRGRWMRQLRIPVRVNAQQTPRDRIFVSCDEIDCGREGRNGEEEKKKRASCCSFLRSSSWRSCRGGVPSGEGASARPPPATLALGRDFLLRAGSPGSLWWARWREEGRLGMGGVR